MDALFSNLNNIKFIQNRSDDCMQNDPLRKHILKNNSSSRLLIEPVPRLFKRLKILYKNNSRGTPLNCATCNTTQKNLEFFYVNGNAEILGAGLPAWYNQLGSFDKNNINAHYDKLLKLYIILKTVEICPVDMLVKECGSFNILHIDAERHNYHVLNSLKLKVLEP